MRRISISNGCRSIRSVDKGLRPSASETCLPAPANLPFGEDQTSSSMLLVFTLRIVVGRNKRRSVRISNGRWIDILLSISLAFAAGCFYLSLCQRERTKVRDFFSKVLTRRWGIASFRLLTLALSSFEEER